MTWVRVPWKVKDIIWFNSRKQDKCINEAVGNGTSDKLVENVEVFCVSSRIKIDMLKFYFVCLFGGLKGFCENFKSPMEVEKRNGGR